MRPEVRDRELLDRHRSQIDRGLADRDDRSPQRPGGRGGELGHAQRDRAGQQASRGAPCPVHGRHSCLPANQIGHVLAGPNIPYEIRQDQSGGPAASNTGS
jgi:hypothetical protein